MFPLLFTQKTKQETKDFAKKQMSDAREEITHVFSLYVSPQRKTKVDQNGPNWTQMDQLDQMERSRLNGNNVDGIGPNRT